MARILVVEVSAQYNRNMTSEGAPARNLGWHSRGYLPHFDEPGLTQMITFRLADSLSPDRLLRLRGQFPATASGAYSNAIENELDAGAGACWLRDPRIAEMVENVLLHGDGKKYFLLCWVVMPNHVHVVIQTIPGWPLDAIVRDWKSFSGREANRLLGRTGAFWQPDYFDRYIRDPDHLEDAGRYIHYNPVKAGLCNAMEDWPWSSYHRIHLP
jgi:REP element-mobilizing transposase RayT